MPDLLDLTELRAIGGAFASTADQIIKSSARMRESVKADIEATTESTNKLSINFKSLSDRLATTVVGAFESLIFKGGSLSDMLRSLALDLSEVAFKAAISPVRDFATGAISSVLSSFIGGFAQGGVFDAGRVRAFASGGVVSGATAFPMQGGFGVMGEAGPEAIMPLTRGPDGRLGVAARGGGGGVIVNITTRDAESFRRSRSQIAAQLSRAVGKGNRNL